MMHSGLKDIAARDQCASLKRMKFAATGLLLLMAGVFGAASAFDERFPWLIWIRVFSEAAMVGALADWFAVTALFRHPLGIPVPHTAIVPSRRNEIGEMLGNFFRNNFLGESIVRKKILEIDMAGRAASWLRISDNRKYLRNILGETAPHLSTLLNDETVRRLFERSAQNALREIEPAVLAGRFLEVLVAGDRDESLMAELAGIAGILVDRHRTFIRERIRDEMPWYVPNFVHDRVYSRLMERVSEILNELRTARHSEIRTLIRRALSELIVSLKESPWMREQGDAVKDWLSGNQVVRTYAGYLWVEMRKRLLENSSHGENIIGILVDRMLRGISESVINDGKVRERINHGFSNFAAAMVENHSQEVVALVTETMQGWDTETLVEKIELQVGRDLQYIRLNGTIVGGIAGVLIYGIARLAGL